MDWNEPEFSELREIWEKRRSKNIKVNLSAALYDMLDWELSEFDYTRSGCGEKTADAIKNFISCKIIESYLNRSENNSVEKYGLTLEELGLRLKGNRVVVDHNWSPEHTQKPRNKTPEP